MLQKRTIVAVRLEQLKVSFFLAFPSMNVITNRVNVSLSTLQAECTAAHDLSFYHALEANSTAIRNAETLLHVKIKK